ncbi:MAG: hypothetical protein EHM93_14915 [Bacteroidales bacterium]|nr:MAG: hypothetical protein EHM93_14915 [Bacteroidales bacterium]
MEKDKKQLFKVIPSTESGIKKVTIHLSKNLSLDEVGAIKLLMVQNFDKYQVFDVRLNDVEAIDMGIIQLLYSFKWTAERKSKKVNFQINLSDEHKLLLEHAGFSELVNNK